MKNLLIISLLFFSCALFYNFGQEVNTSTMERDKPVLFIPKNHQQNFKLLKKTAAKSFYKSKPEWQHIIDSTWGPGDPLPQKLLIFNTYAKAVHDEFDGFKSLNLNWDSLYNYYLNKINDSTCRGAFSAIMSHFACGLKDIHTKAYDSTVIWTPLNPGVPVLLLGSYLSVEHFGAVTTILPDSTTLVLRVVPNHPLGLQPGDIILGYEGKPWKDLVKELFDAGLPISAATGGCPSADTYLNLSGAGLNWHLFDTIDVLKYSSDDTLHLSVQPLLNLNVPPMANNEQLAIPNIPFPDVINDGCATYGVLENSNIGYIFLGQEYPTTNAEVQFYDAVNALKNTDALIIDMRLNYGGWAQFYNAFQILFNESLNTLADAYRCSSNTFDLCSANNYADYFIDGKPPKFYDRPIAVLLGPTCVSDGDLTAQRLRFHPMVKFFGKSPDASLGFSKYITNFPGWFLRYSIADVFHINNPGVYLNKREFPIDFPVWHNCDDIVKGKDAVAEKALDWINNLVYTHNFLEDKAFYRPGIDTLKFTTLIENPNSHQITSTAYLNNSEGNLVDSLILNRATIMNNSEKWEGNILAPKSEDFYRLSISASDITDSKVFKCNNALRLSTAGPVTVDSISFIRNSNSYISIRPFLHNCGNTKTIKNVSIKLNSKDPWIKIINPVEIISNDIPPDSTIGVPAWCNIGYIDSLWPGYFNLTFDILSDGWTYWSDSVRVNILSLVGINHKELEPLAFNLGQNYPNPFNPGTSIQYSISNRQFVTLKVYDILGREMTTLVNEYKPAGKYETEFNAKNLPSGIYFYRMNAGKFTSVKKMILIK